MPQIYHYGLDGYCEDCDPELHGHPLHNLVEIEEVPEEPLSPVDEARLSAVAKLKKLGLTDEEIGALIP